MIDFELNRDKKEDYQFVLLLFFPANELMI